MTDENQSDEDKKAVALAFIIAALGEAGELEALDTTVLEGNVAFSKAVQRVVSHLISTAETQFELAFSNAEKLKETADKDAAIKVFEAINDNLIDAQQKADEVRRISLLFSSLQIPSDYLNVGLRADYIDKNADNVLYKNHIVLESSLGEKAHKEYWQRYIQQISTLDVEKENG